MLASWQFWAVLSAGFAALTAIFAKIGVEQVGSDFATFVRTVVILAVLAGMLTVMREWQPLGSVSRRSYLFLVLSGLATGGSWLCYLRALQLGG
jgi:bacterial/archaeal transporter family protein